MSNHENFKMLSALLAIGQISSEEERDLREHLKVCSECRQVHAECSHIVGNELPRKNASRSWIDFLFSNFRVSVLLRDRFVKRVSAEGIRLSAEASRPSGVCLVPLLSSHTSRTAVLVLGVLAVVMFGFAAFREYREIERPATPIAVDVRAKGPSISSQTELSSLRQALQAASKQLEQMKAAESARKASLDLRLQQAQERAEMLSTELRQSRAENQDVRDELERRDAENARLSAQMQRALAERSELALSHQEVNERVATLREQIQSLERERLRSQENSLAQQARIRQVSDDLNRRIADLEREQELAAVSNEVRQLMGARKLHIIDVKDVDGGRTPPRAFGRVFYAEGQSLIFYAFDLPNGRSGRANFNFQVWGAREGDPQLARSLGALASDDTQQGRWVLKVSDPKLFSGIDSVFVTAESKGPSNQPRGKKLLYAYIAGLPNHP